MKSITSSILVGLGSGCLIGVIGGNLLKCLGMTGYLFDKTDKLQLSLGSFNVSFSLQNELSYRLLGASSSGVGVCIYFLFSVFAIGLGEEIFWRGFVQKKISDHFSLNKSVWITAALFALIHSYVFTILPFKTGMLFLLLIAIVGAMWGYLFNYFGNIWVSAISHGVVAFIIWKYYFFV
ncbi:MAG TPA: CPBP family intramembrane metalloprotease [Candidatus Omnitrophota bacterium]|nr:CPBP family intramembrane metalloprotease [Candidatus Omnitrophota bacterium]